MTLRAWFEQEPFTLVLSAGFFGFYAHTGFLMALQEANIKPRSFAGSSAGALVSGLAGAGLPAGDVYTFLNTLKRDAFWDPKLGLGLLRGDRFRHILRDMLPTNRFEEAPYSISLSVFDVFGCKTKTLSGPGALDTAISASCAVPVFFQPVYIQGRPYLDGGILDRAGFHSISKGDRVFFHNLSNSGPWRRKGSKSLAIPNQCDAMVSLTISGLPAIHPFKLENGKVAMDRAYELTKNALEMPVEDGTNLLLNG